MSTEIKKVATGNMNGPVYRSLAVRELNESAAQVFSQRKQMWMRVIGSTVPLLIFASVTMPQWKYYIWGVSLPSVFVLILLWDYWFHIRHIQQFKLQQSTLILKDDGVEAVYAIERPDKLDYIAPYVMFTVCMGTVIGLDLLQAEYRSRYSDGRVITVTEGAYDVLSLQERNTGSIKKG